MVPHHGSCELERGAAVTDVHVLELMAGGAALGALLLCWEVQGWVCIFPAYFLFREWFYILLNCVHLHVCLIVCLD